jgi:predicted metal-dependent peptidase
MAKANVSLTPDEKMSWSKTRLVLDHTFFASVGLQLDIHEDKENKLPIPTMGTDGKEIIWSREFVSKVNTEEVLGVVVHEVMHVVLLHPFRRGNRDFLIWNLACDYAVNLMLVDCGFKLPPGVLLDNRFAGWEAEKIYEYIIKNAQKYKAMIKSFGEGSGNVGQVSDYPSNGSEAEMKAGEQSQQIENAKAAQAAMRRQGNLPAGLKRILEELNQPRINWKEALSQFIETTSKCDYTWELPNAKYVGHNVYLPTVKSPEIGMVVNLIDASGSISREELKEEVSEIQGILAAYEKMELQVSFFDTKAMPFQEITDDTDINKMKIEAGGGTDFRCGFKQMEKEQLEPICIIVFTDGECDSFPKNPDIPVLWLLTYNNKRFKPPFGDVIIMNYDKDR